MTARWFSTECGGGAGQRMADGCLGKWGAKRSRDGAHSRNGALTVCDEGFEGAGIVPLAYEENVSRCLVAVADVQVLRSEWPRSLSAWRSDSTSFKEAMARTGGNQSATVMAVVGAVWRR
jgi:hypothetical protein